MINLPFGNHAWHWNITNLKMISPLPNDISFQLPFLTPEVVFHPIKPTENLPFTLLGGLLQLQMSNPMKISSITKL